MRSSGWSRLTAGLVAVCLAGGVARAADAPAAGAVSSQGEQAAARFELAPWGYAAGVGNEAEYEKHLGKELQEYSNRAAQSVAPVDDPVAGLEAAAFALTWAVEPDLTRVWLWRQPQARPELTIPALTLACSGLSNANRILERWKPGPATDVWAGRVQALTALLAMETALLTEGDPAGEALAAAGMLAEPAMEKVPTEAQATWQLLIAGCLAKGGRPEDAQLRLQMVLRQYRGSDQAAAACMLQARMLAEAGKYAAAVGLVSEYLQTLPAKGGQPTSAPASQKADARVVQCSLSLLKARLLKEWAEKMSHSQNELDRKAAAQVREQAATWEKQAEELGPSVLRLAPMLQGLARGPQ